jgi:hypothetical protein
VISSFTGTQQAEKKRKGKKKKEKKKLNSNFKSSPPPLNCDFFPSSQLFVSVLLDRRLLPLLQQLPFSENFRRAAATHYRFQPWPPQ